MNTEPDYLTKIQEDWPFANQLHLQLFLRYAYNAVHELVYSPKRNLIFSTPNRAWFAGINRYGAVDYFLERACEMKLLTGISPVWTPLTSGDNPISALELRGKNTSLIAHHLHFPDDTPRGSILRDDKRLHNQQNPVLPGFGENQEPTSSLINLMLVHGGKAGEFSFIRVYHNFDQPKSFIPISENIMTLTATGTSGAEQIADAEVKLKKHLEEIKKQQAQE